MKMLNESMIGQQCMFLGYDAKTPLAKAGIKGTPNFVMRNVTANEFFSSYLNPADSSFRENAPLKLLLHIFSPWGVVCHVIREVLVLVRTC
jgi:hypothetical protein